MLRPLSPLSPQLREHAHFTVTIESSGGTIADTGRSSLADEAQRQSLLSSRKPGEGKALTFIEIDATRFRVHPRDFVDADLKAIHDSPGTDARDMH